MGFTHVFLSQSFYRPNSPGAPGYPQDLVADVVGLRLYPGAQWRYLDTWHGRAQGLDALLDGVGHQLVARFGEGHLERRSLVGRKTGMMFGFNNRDFDE